jgi:hypothetical protein
MTQIQSEKSSTKYMINIKRSFDRARSEYIILKITVSEELRQLIKSAAIDEDTEESLRLGEIDMKFQRYKVKKWVYSALSYSNYKALIFHKHLLDESEIMLEFDSVRVLDEFLTSLKQNVKTIIQTILNYSDIDMIVSFGVEK